MMTKTYLPEDFAHDFAEELRHFYHVLTRRGLANQATPESQSRVMAAPKHTPSSGTIESTSSGASGTFHSGIGGQSQN